MNKRPQKNPLLLNLSILTKISLVLLFLFIPISARAQEQCPRTSDSTTQTLLDEQCKIHMPYSVYKVLRTGYLKWYWANTTAPVFNIQPTTIVVDRDGRVYSQPPTYSVTVTVGTLTVTGLIKNNPQVFYQPPPQSGLGIRYKFSAWYAPTKYVKGFVWRPLDAGLLIEPYHYSWVNVNLGVGVKSINVGLGADLTKNFGLYAAGANFYEAFKKTIPVGGLYFSFN